MIAPAYTYRAQLVRVVDADTVVVDVDLGFNVTARQTFRLHGINAPEVVGVSKAAGLAAKDALTERLRGASLFSAPVLIVETFKDRTEKYGRFLARIWADGQDVNEWLVDQGHAVRSAR